MKKQQKEVITKKIEHLQEEAKKETLKLEAIHSEAKRINQDLKMKIEENERKISELITGESIRERIENRIKLKNELNKIQDEINKLKAEEKENNIIKNIIDSFLESIYKKYLYNINLLMMENIRNNRDFNEFMSLFSYKYDGEKGKYIYKNICYYKNISSRWIYFDFDENIKILPFKKEIKNQSIYNKFIYNDYQNIKYYDFENIETVEEEKENIKKDIKKLDSKIEEFIYNYYELKRYIKNIININEEYQEKIKQLHSEKDSKIEENDLYNLKNLILKEV